MSKEFIPYEQALELKELGFDEECLGNYVPYFSKEGWKLNLDIERMNLTNSLLQQGFSAPLYQQAFRWFREKYGMLYTIEENLEDDQVWYEWDVKSSNGFEGSFEATYEEAELACLIKLIEIAKNK